MEDVPLPFLLVEVLPYNCLLLCSPTRSSIVSIESGHVLHSIDYANALQAPRCFAVVALTGHASSSNTSINEDIDCLIALLNDEKDLKVYKISGLQSLNVSAEEIFTSALPKRGVKMLWEGDDIGSTDFRLVIGDRHGDVRSFLVPLKQSAEEHATKKQRLEIQSEQNGQNGSSKDDVEEDIDLNNPPHLGHASMLTDFLLTSFTEESSPSPAKFIITSDRDEHIRISRWGKRRAGYLALRYLLGSQEAIGGMCVIGQEDLKALQSTSTTESTRSFTRQPLLVSTDSSYLRIWSLHRDSEIAEDRPDCLLSIDLRESIIPFVKVDANLERTRERTFAKGVSKSKKRQDQALGFQEHIGGVLESIALKDCPIVMRHLSVSRIDGEVYVSFLVDGASALFSIAMSSLLASPEEVLKYLHILDVGSPVLDFASYSKGSDRFIWLALDIRHAKGIVHNVKSLKLARWDSKTQNWIEVTSGMMLLEKASDIQSRGTSDLANSLLLYDALCLYPKQDFELATNMKDAIAPNGLIRGGLANFERMGMNKDENALNGGNNERNMLKKVQMREEMLKRIEKSLGEGASGTAS